MLWEHYQDDFKVFTAELRCDGCGQRYLGQRKETEIWPDGYRPLAPRKGQTAMMDLLPTNTLLYVSDICPKQEKTKDETKKIIEIVFKLQPFTAEMAELMGIFDRLFDRQEKPLDDVLSIAIGLKNVPLYNMTWRLSQDAPDALDLSDVKVSTTLHVRRDKEGPVFAATFSASVLYPSANDLLTILHAYTESRYVSFEASTQNLPLVDGEVLKPGDVLRPGVLAE